MIIVIIALYRMLRVFFTAGMNRFTEVRNGSGSEENSARVGSLCLTHIRWRLEQRVKEHYEQSLLRSLNEGVKDFSKINQHRVIPK
jgi:hypothetical protein